MKGLVGFLFCIFGVCSLATALPQDIGSIHFQDEELRHGQECRQGSSKGVCIPFGECSEFDYNQNVSRVFCSTKKIRLICCVPKPITKADLALINRAREIEANFIEYKKSSSYEKCLNINEIYINLIKIFAAKNDFPHIVSIGLQKADEIIDWRCSGTILSEKFILTSSHCIHSEFKPVVIRATNKNNQQTLNDDDYKISEIFLNGEIALIETIRPIIFHKYVRPACLYHESFLEQNNKLQKLSWTDSQSFEFKVDAMHIVEDSNCKNNENDKEVICAKSIASECAESLNGVLQMQLPSLQDMETKMYDLHYVLGIEATGTKCPQETKKFIAVYTYREWIEGIVWPKSKMIGNVIKDSTGSNIRSEVVETKGSAGCLNRYLGLRKTVDASLNEKEAAGVQGEFPHLAAVGWSFPDGKIEWHCSGTLMSKDFVLTPAHCTYYFGKEPDVIRLGDLSLISDADNQNIQQFEIESIIRHDDYSTKLDYNDIALIRLNRSALITENVIPACIRQDSSNPSVFFQGIGYAQSTDLQVQADKLQKISLSYMSRQKCNESYKESRKSPEGLKEGQICAENISDDASKIATCFGDNSGALQIEEHVNGKRVPVIAGLTSFGMACASNVPNVYTDVFFYKNWIESNIYE